MFLRLISRIFAYTLVAIATPTQAVSQINTILVLGDSISAGYGIPPGSGWVSLLQQELATDSADACCTVINASISGETTGGGAARLPRLLEEHQPDLVILELGGNDGLRGYPLKNTRNNLETIIETSKAQGAKLLLAGMKIPPNYGRRYSEGFHQIYYELAEVHDIALIPFLLEGVAGNSALMQIDDIHPRAEAQAQLLGNVKQVLDPFLPGAAKLD